MNDIKLGDVVMLKSGGPSMTVVSFNHNNDGMVRCKFISGSSVNGFAIHEIIVPKEALRVEKDNVEA